MGLYDVMYLVPEEQYKAGRFGAASIDGVGGDVKDSQINNIEVTGGGTLIVRDDDDNDGGVMLSGKRASSAGLKSKGGDGEEVDIIDDDYAKSLRAKWHPSMARYGKGFKPIAGGGGETTDDPFPFAAESKVGQGR